MAGRFLLLRNAGNIKVSYGPRGVMTSELQSINETSQLVPADVIEEKWRYQRKLSPRSGHQRGILCALNGTRSQATCYNCHRSLASQFYEFAFPRKSLCPNPSRWPYISVHGFMAQRHIRKYKPNSSERQICVDSRPLRMWQNDFAENSRWSSTPQRGIRDDRWEASDKWVRSRDYRFGSPAPSSLRLADCTPTCEATWGNNAPLRSG